MIDAASDAIARIPERQDAYGGQREAGMLAEKASAVSKILPEGPHMRHRRLVATNVSFSEDAFCRLPHDNWLIRPA
jgi:hypothetical protein